ncbi:hypothetical protein [Pseudochelatococcus contaminans]|uniref:Uncharacterized protein n=1 Tax=Pseudochelatococcus contaminans TaxID=1538103 RepID=A0A7W6EGM9_9HYPH|nr:hypothetical protein [Pseudochelatococcus contaminans]MBB3809137.1 hypothetical protein [Pseudochelatococcus contaminans]
MRRTSRSFTVEVKRSRSRAGESAGTDVKVRRDQSFSAAAPAQLSWGDLITRAVDDIGLAADLPEEFEPAPEKTHAVAVVDRDPAVDAVTPRILPSLLPVETPSSTPEHEEDAHHLANDDDLPPVRKVRAPTRRAPLQPEKAPRNLQSTAVEPAAPEPEAVTGGAFDARYIRAMVEGRLRLRSGTDETSGLPAAHEADEAGSDPVSAEVDAPPIGKRRRQDFWKRRLRSYAARD